jgi:hypothetical protein
LSWFRARIYYLAFAMSALLTRAVFAFLALALFPAPASAQMQVARNNALIQQVHVIGIAMFAYACDNNGAYPTGNSSTEVFQKLIDGGYVSEPSTFYVKMTGKVAPSSSKLKPENVCFDVTVAVDGKSSDMVPLVYLTGFRLDFTPDSTAVPVSDAVKQFGGISLFYKGNSSAFHKSDPDGSVPHLIVPAYQDATHYHQLTPVGPIDLA